MAAGGTYDRAQNLEWKRTSKASIDLPVQCNPFPHTNPRRRDEAVKAPIRMMEAGPG